MKLDIKSWTYKKVISFILSAVVILIVLTFIAERFTGEIKPFKDYEAIIVVSGSMEPAIKTNSLNLSEKVTSTDDINVGDIVTFTTSVGIVSHRCVSKETYNGETYLYTKGDNNEEPDGILVDNSMVKGKIVYTANWLAPVISKFSTDIDVVAAMYRLMVIIILLAIIVKLSIKPISKNFKAMYLVAKPDKFKEQALRALDRAEVYREHIECMDFKIKTSKHKLRTIYHLGKALESIDDINENLDDIEERSRKMKKVK